MLWDQLTNKGTAHQAKLGRFLQLRAFRRFWRRLGFAREKKGIGGATMVWVFLRKGCPGPVPVCQASGGWLASTALATSESPSKRWTFGIPSRLLLYFRVLSVCHFIPGSFWCLKGYLVCTPNIFLPLSVQSLQVRARDVISVRELGRPVTPLVLQFRNVHEIFFYFPAMSQSSMMT